MRLLPAVFAVLVSACILPANAREDDGRLRILVFGAHPDCFEGIDRHDDRTHAFAPLPVRHAQHQHVEDRRVRAQRGLDRGRRDLHAAADDHVVRSAVDAQR
jgi:hypothetical protein